MNVWSVINGKFLRISSVCLWPHHRHTTSHNQIMFFLSFDRSSDNTLSHTRVSQTCTLPIHWWTQPTAKAKMYWSIIAQLPPSRGGGWGSRCRRRETHINVRSRFSDSQRCRCCRTEWNWLDWQNDGRCTVVSFVLQIGHKSSYNDIWWQLPSGIAKPIMFILSKTFLY